MAVFALVSSVAGFIKVRFLADKAVVDGYVFRLHYRFTSAALFVCCILVTANNLIGDTISCIKSGDLPENVINTYCWIHSTFTLPHAPGKEIGRHEAHPGVRTPDYETEIKHAYYQWVPFVLFFQGLLFYIPHWMWKQWEEGRIRMITDGMRGIVTGRVDERKEKEIRLVDYFVESLNLHNVYAIGYYICHVLNFVNVLGNIFFVDRFLGGAFLRYGTDVLSFTQMDSFDRRDPLIDVFPLVTKCTFHKFGPSGTIQQFDIMCVLALNIINQKIYIFLWFWFVVLAIITGLSIIYIAALAALPTLRAMVLRRHFKPSSHISLKPLIQRTQIGDFLLLKFLGHNLNTIVFTEILEELCRRLHLENNLPRSTLELSPIYPDKYGKESET